MGAWLALFDAALQFLEPLLLRQFVKLYSAILGDGYGHSICIKGVLNKVFIC